MRALPNILCPFFIIMSEAKSQIGWWAALDRKSTRLNSSHSQISYAVFCLKKKTAHTGRRGCQHLERQSQGVLPVCYLDALIREQRCPRFHLFDGYRRLSRVSVRVLAPHPL